MLEIFAIMACHYYADPAWQKANGCSLALPFNLSYVYRSFEACEAARKDMFLESIKQELNGDVVVYECMHKTVPAWQP